MMPDDIGWIYSAPSLVSSQQITAGLLWTGAAPSEQTLAPPTSPSDVSAAPAPIFRTNTNELDKYRALFLILGVLIGVYVVSK